MSINNKQLDTIMKASGLLPPQQRGGFVRSVEGHLADKAYVTGSDLRRAISFILSNYGVSAPTKDSNYGQEKT